MITELGERHDLELLTSVANRLNEMVQADYDTMSSLVSPIYVCSESLIESPALCIPLQDNMVGVSVVGVLGGCLPLKTQSYQLAIEFLQSKFVGFKVVNCKNNSTNQTERKDDGESS
jgi:hypothetical protein